ncbi:MAG: ABC transporter permease subunit [SAR324 cluster bacterium]|nr:ABC transporter permease subunit [SAR324 cluster bacterium]
MQRPSASPPSGASSLLRQPRVLSGLAQALFAAVVVFAAAAMLSNMAAELDKRGLPLGFGFLEQPASFAIAEGLLDYTESDSYWRAFSVGVVNTIQVSLLGIVLATLLGTVIGVSRLSTNLMVRTLAGAYVETVRNVPLLVQLFVWYTIVFLNLPPLRNSLTLPGGFFLNNRGVHFPSLGLSPDWGSWLIGLVIVAAFALLAGWRVNRRRVAEGRPPLGLWAAAGGLLAVALFVTAGWIAVGSSPVVPDYPVLKGFNFRGGARVSPEFAALLTGLTIYTAAFIAELVRAGVQAVGRGQSEAAAALGLTRGQALRHVILPQALRVILPPLVNQYLNLTKNSSLAVAIAFPDLVAIGNTIINQSGNAVQLIVLIMGSYLAMSLAISFLLNQLSKRTRFAGQ